MMKGIAEIFFEEVVARLQALPLFGVQTQSIRRKHRTPVTRDEAPAIHVIDGTARPKEVKSCDWQWAAEATIRVFVRDDAGIEAADPIVAEVMRRINPEAAPPYSNGVRLEISSIKPEDEIADGDAVGIDIGLSIKFGTAKWTTDVPAA